MIWKEKKKTGADTELIHALYKRSQHNFMRIKAKQIDRNIIIIIDENENMETNSFILQLARALA